MILLFYYGLLFLGTLSISDGVATFLVLCLVDFLLLKAIWDSYEPIVSWRKQIKEQTKDWREWWKHLSELKKVFFVLIVLVSPIFIASFALIFPQFIIKINAPDTTFYNLSVAIFAILSGIGALFGFYTSAIRTETAEQGLITERLNKAIENLGKSTDDGDPVIEVRLGALYALERIAQDSLRDHISVMEILCAYIRENSPRKKEHIEHDVDDPELLRKDIQTTLTIIGRRDKWVRGKKYLKKEAEQNYRIDLRHCNLRNAELQGTYLSRAKFYNTDLSYANFNRANISYAHFQLTELVDTNFHYADMSYATLLQANLTDTEFLKTNMSCVELSWAIMDGTWFISTNMEGVYAQDGNFSKFHMIREIRLEQIFFGKGVLTPDNLKLKKPSHWPKKRQPSSVFMDSYKQWLEKTYPDLAKGFLK